MVTEKPTKNDLKMAIYSSKTIEETAKTDEINHRPMTRL